MAYVNNVDIYERTSWWVLLLGTYVTSAIFPCNIRDVAPRAGSIRTMLLENEGNKLAGPLEGESVYFPTSFDGNFNC